MEKNKSYDELIKENKLLRKQIEKIQKENLSATENSSNNQFTDNGTHDEAWMFNVAKKRYSNTNPSITDL